MLSPVFTASVHQRPVDDSSDCPASASLFFNPSKFPSNSMNKKAFGHLICTDLMSVCRPADWILRHKPVKISKVI